MLLDLPTFVYRQNHVVHASGWQLTAIVTDALLVLAAWFPRLSGLNPPVWSISAEIFFYLTFPLLGPWIWRMSGRRAGGVCLAVYVAGLALVWWLPAVITDPEVILVNPLLHLNQFLCGIGLAKLFQWLHGHEAWGERVRRISPGLLMLAGDVFIAVCLSPVPIARRMVQHGVFLPLFAMTILAVSSGHATISRVLSARWLVVLGEASFGLYLLHIPLWVYFRRLVVVHQIAGVAVYLGVVIGLSLASFFWFETPARKRIMRALHEKNQENKASLAMA